MASIAVAYSSKYGATKKYAEWIALELAADLFDASSVKPAKLADYDIVVYGGALYAGSIRGAKAIAKCHFKSLVVFTVGIADPNSTDYSAILANSLGPDLLDKTKAFHLRGGIDYQKLGLVHKMMMAMRKKITAKKEESRLTDEERGFLKTYGRTIDFTDKSTIKPLIEYVRALLGASG